MLVFNQCSQYNWGLCNHSFVRNLFGDKPQNLMRPSLHIGRGFCNGLGWIRPCWLFVDAISTKITYWVNKCCISWTNDLSAECTLHCDLVAILIGILYEYPWFVCCLQFLALCYVHCFVCPASYSYLIRSVPLDHCFAWKVPPATPKNAVGGLIYCPEQLLVANVVATGR